MAYFGSLRLGHLGVTYHNDMADGKTYIEDSPDGVFDKIFLPTIR